MNLVGKWGDDPAAVAENRRLFAAAGGFSLERLFVAKQVHGVAVIEVGAAQTPAEVASVEADALVTNVAGAVLAISTADCVPLLFANATGTIVGAAHAGWRGTVQGVVAKTVAALDDLGAAPRELHVALGPSICVGCFEVGEEVAREFAEAGAGVVRRDLGAKPHVDLQLAHRLALDQVGVSADRVDGAPPCTMCEPDRFYSFRRDKGTTGGHLSFVRVGV
ncbi:MAG: peptidoglycan editing factor PgeF [Deltaproteobacteria bacterium]|nr:peptidoglycan editing factor PgeF [Deltaproteobacteria bacterium]